MLPFEASMNRIRVVPDKILRHNPSVRMANAPIGKLSIPHLPKLRSLLLKDLRIHFFMRNDLKKLRNHKSTRRLQGEPKSCVSKKQSINQSTKLPPKLVGFSYMSLKHSIQSI